MWSPKEMGRSVQLVQESVVTCDTLQTKITEKQYQIRGYLNRIFMISSKGCHHHATAATRPKELQSASLPPLPLLPRTCVNSRHARRQTREIPCRGAEKLCNRRPDMCVLSSNVFHPRAQRSHYQLEPQGHAAKPDRLFHLLRRHRIARN